MILKYYVDKEHIEKAFKEFDNIKNKDYYAQMAVAWAVSCYFIKFKNETMQYLKNNNLDNFLDFIKISPLSKEQQEKVLKQIIPGASYDTLFSIQNVAHENLRFAIMMAKE